MSHLSRAEKARLRMVLDVLDDNLADAETRETRAVLSGCKRAVAYLLGGTSSTHNSTPVDALHGVRDALG